MSFFLYFLLNENIEVNKDEATTPICAAASYLPTESPENIVKTITNIFTGIVRIYSTYCFPTLNQYLDRP